MNNSKYLYAIIALCLLLTGLTAWAKEDTVYLSFRKSAPSRPGTTVYTVKKGEWLLDIVRRVTGETKFRKAIIRKYNPGIKDLNRIYPGQKIVLPVKNRQAALPAMATSAAGAAAPRPQAFLSDAAAFPDAGKWLLIRQILAKIDAAVVSKGKYYLPLSGMGQLTIDCHKIPLVEFSDQGLVFLDFRRQLPENVVQLVRQSWKNVAVLRIDPRLTAPEILVQIVGASGTHTMSRPAAPLAIGEQPRLQIPCTWIIVRKGVVSGPRKNLALWMRTEEMPSLPAPLRSLGAAGGWEIIEIAGDKILAPPPDENMPPRPVTRLASSSLLETAADLFPRLEFPVTRNTSLKIFDSRRDGFDLIVKADLLVTSGDKKLVIMNRRLPNQFVGILKNSATEAVFPTPGETNSLFLERACRALGILGASGSFTLPLAAKGDLANVSLIFSGMKVATNKGGVVYLIDFDPGERLNGFLTRDMGIPVIKY